MNSRINHFKWNHGFHAVLALGRIVWLLLPVMLAIVCICKFGVTAGIVTVLLWMLKFFLRLMKKMICLILSAAAIVLIIYLLIL